MGDYLYREGDASYDFHVVISGAVDIVVHSDGEERVITRHGAGRFLGELNLLTGMRVFVSARGAESGTATCDRDEPAPGRRNRGPGSQPNVQSRVTLSRALSRTASS